MTKNQIEYNKLLETRRANFRQEELTASRDMEAKRHNFAQEGLTRQSLDETARANLAREAETNRSNLANEELQRSRNAETARANRAQEALTGQQIAETRRSNLAREALQSSTLQEQIRFNKAQESLRSKEIDIRGGELQVRRDTLSETVRSNRARETETHRSNVAKEQETYRSNVAHELETNRANVAREVETERHNKVGEKVDIGRAATYAADVAGRLIYYNKDHGSSVTVAPYQNTSGSTPDRGLSTSPSPNSTGPRTGGNINIKGGNYNGEKTQANTQWQDIYQTVRQRSYKQGSSFGAGRSNGSGFSKSGIKK